MINVGMSVQKFKPLHINCGDIKWSFCRSRIFLEPFETYEEFFSFLVRIHYFDLLRQHASLIFFFNS